MRSTRGKTRASRVIASLPPKPRMTDAARITAPLHSNAPTHNPGNALPSVRRGTFGAMNTNQQLARGGFSSYYRPRQGWGYGL
jgi:hypothetical protein